MAKKPTRKEMDALDRAQEIAWDAWDAGSAKRRVELAEKALAISPLCADAWGILAQQAEPGSDKELDLWLKGVEAGKAALGDSFDEMVGEFWGWTETRPYMRAREGLARALWERGMRDETVGHLQDMLLLNPNDNQGLRYPLVAYLAEMDRHDAIAALKQAYPEEDMAMWTWPLALAEFRRNGDTADSRKALAEAVESNPHVAPYLLGLKKLPKRQPDFYGLGDSSEAVLYVSDFGGGWTATPGAIDWLRANAPAGKQRRRTGYRSKD